MYSFCFSGSRDSLKYIYNYGLRSNLCMGSQCIGILQWYRFSRCNFSGDGVWCSCNQRFCKTAITTRSTRPIPPAVLCRHRPRRCRYIYYSDVIMGATAPQITCLTLVLNRLFRRRSKKISKLRVTGLCEGNSLVTGEFPAQRASDAENGSIQWRHHVQRRNYTTMTSHGGDGVSDHPQLDCLFNRLFKSTA